MVRHLFAGHYFSTNSNTKLYVRNWVPECPKAFVIFIHGAGEHSGKYAHVGEECVKNGIAFIAPDMRGFGQSNGPRGHVRRFQDYLNDLDRLVVHLHGQKPELPIFLMGHSFGGLVAIRYVQQFGDRIHGIILTSPALGIAPAIPPFIQKMMGFVSYLAPALPLELVRWNERLGKYKWFQAKFPYWTSDLMNDHLATITYTPRWISELIRNGTKALSENHPVRLPILCMYDRYDPLVNSDRIERFVESLDASDKTLTVYARGNHQFLYNPDVVQSIIQWLSERLTPDGAQAKSRSIPAKRE